MTMRRALGKHTTVLGWQLSRDICHCGQPIKAPDTLRNGAMRSRAWESASEEAMSFTIKVNGTPHAADVDGDTPLLWVLRDVLGMTGTKFGCGMAMCGACTVHIDGVATRSCITPIESVGASEVTTIEAIGATTVGAKIQKAWLDREVVQCGYCQSGQIMSATALLASNPHPTDSDIDDAMSGNICRCGTYVRIREAIKQAAKSIEQGG
jgi:isoquinoline 1-oxidoreductase alpha subunit